MEVNKQCLWHYSLVQCTYTCSSLVVCTPVSFQSLYTTGQGGNEREIDRLLASCIRIWPFKQFILHSFVDFASIKAELQNRKCQYIAIFHNVHPVFCDLFSETAAATVVVAATATTTPPLTKSIAVCLYSDVNEKDTNVHTFSISSFLYSGFLCSSSFSTKCATSSGSTCSTIKWQ